MTERRDGWILAKSFCCVFMDRDEVEVHKFAKKEQGQYPVILTEQTWSIKDLGKFSCVIQRIVPSGLFLLARSGSQSQRAISFILPVRGASHDNKYYLLTESEVITGKSQTEALMY